MKKLLLILFCLPLFLIGQEKTTKAEKIKEFFKFGTFYGAVNGGTSISDVDIFSIETGELSQSVIATPYDYSIILGVRKMKQFGYQPKEAFKRGTEASFSDAATIGRWKNNLEFLFEVDYKRQEGVDYVNQHHFIRYVMNDGCSNKYCWKHFITKIEYLEDNFSDIKYFEASERYHYNASSNLSFNIGAVQRLAEPYGYDPIDEWYSEQNFPNASTQQYTSGTFTQLAIEEGYSIGFDGNGGVEYFDPRGNVVATSKEVWEAVVIPTVVDNFTQQQRDAQADKLQHSIVIGFDYYKYTKKSWLHCWGNVMPWHYNDGSQYSYHGFNEGQWQDIGVGMIYGHWFSKNLGVFLEGTYNRYWNREWHGFSVGVNYRVF